MLDSLLEKIKNRRERWLIIAAIAAISLFAADTILLSPFVKRWQGRSEEIRELKSKIFKGESIVQQEARWLQRQAENNEKYLSGVYEEAENELLRKVEEWTRQTGVIINSMLPRQATGDGDTILELRLTGAGSINAIVQLLLKIETADLAIAVQQLNLVPARPDGRRLNFEIQVTGLKG